MSTAEKIEQEAAGWLARREGGQWSAADEAALESWLDASTAQRLAYVRLRAAWKRADRLAALRPALGDAARRHWTRRHGRSIAACFAIFAIAGAGGTAWWLQPPVSAYRTAVGSHETVRLADGSMLELNTDTQLHATVDAKERRVVLEKGEVYFQVVHDAARPFVVMAGTRRIVDLGTKFSVRRSGDKVSVIVTEGRVRIENLETPKAAPPVVAKQDVQVLTSADSTLVTAKTPQQVNDALGWRRGMLIFHRERLADAADEFNRYNAKKLVIAGSVAAQTPIGGSFDATNVEAFAGLMRDGFGFKVEETTDEIRISD